MHIKNFQYLQAVMYTVVVTMYLLLLRSTLVDSVLILPVSLWT